LDDLLNVRTQCRQYFVAPGKGTSRPFQPDNGQLVKSNHAGNLFGGPGGVSVRNCLRDQVFGLNHTAAKRVISLPRKGAVRQPYQVSVRNFLWQRIDYTLLAAL
jgi:hypothetical protein